MLAERSTVTSGEKRRDGGGNLAAAPRASRSTSAWSGCIAAAVTRQRRATERTAARQPQASASDGSIAPARRLPSGTPVWRSEKTMLSRSGGVTLMRTCEEAGVAGGECGGGFVLELSVEPDRGHGGSVGNDE